MQSQPSARLFDAAQALSNFSQATQLFFRRRLEDKPLGASAATPIVGLDVSESTFGEWEEAMLIWAPQSMQH